MYKGDRSDLVSIIPTKQEIKYTTYIKYKHDRNIASILESISFGVHKDLYWDSSSFYVTKRRKLKELNGAIKSIANFICLYAYDTNITISGKSKEEIEVSLSHSLVKQLIENIKLLNLKMTNLIAVCTKQSKNKKSRTIKIENSQLDQVDYKVVGPIY